MSLSSVVCPECGKRYRLKASAAGDVPDTIQCRECHTEFSTNTAAYEEEQNLPELPKIKRKRTRKREVDGDEEHGNSAVKRSNRRPKRDQRQLSPLIVIAIFTVVVWTILGVAAMLPGLEVITAGGLLINSLVFMVWGIAGISLVVQEENETHGAICWSTLLILLAPVIPCIAVISLVGLLMIFFYGLTRINKTGLYVVLILLSIALFAVFGVVVQQFKL